MKNFLVLATFALLPMGMAAQEVDPSEKLREVLPPEVAEQVLEQMEAARSMALPAQALANLALEGVAKGRSAEEVLEAVEALSVEFSQAQAALQSAGHSPRGGEVEAATAAMRMGVDGAAVSALARSGIDGRGLEVPLLVLGGLATRGLPADQALAMVQEGMAAGFGDAGMLEGFPAMAPGFAGGSGPGQAGPSFAGGPGGFQVPVVGITVPVGPPGDRPGRGRPPGGN